VKLLTKALLAALPKLYSAENVPLDEKVAVVKIFDPCGRGTWYVFEGEEQEGDVIFFGYVVSPLGPDCDEMGNFSLQELEAVKNRFHLPLERDIYWKPTKMAEVLNG
jgi:hypothetical protein